MCKITKNSTKYKIQGEKTMKTFKLNFLEFVRTKFCIIIYIVVNASMFLSSLYRMFFDTMVPGRLFVLSDVKTIRAAGFTEVNLKFAAIIFIMFLFTSHYYFSQARKNEFLECASVTATEKTDLYESIFCYAHPYINYLRGLIFIVDNFFVQRP